MTTSTPAEPMVGTGMYSDAIDHCYRSTARYLAAAAVAARGREPNVAPSHGPVLVGEVMTQGVVAAREGAVFKEIVDALVRNHVSAVPVVDDKRRVVGVVSESDLLARVSGGHLARPRGHRLHAHAETRRKLHAATAGELMTWPAVTTTPHTHIVDAAHVAVDARVRRLPVVDDAGVLVGIVTHADLLRPFLRPDKEIRDDIRSNVVIGAMILDPFSVEVDVVEGVVTLRGQLERRLVADGLIESCRGVAGVVDVDSSGLTYRFNDTLTPPLRAPMY